jgi:hypothetical protein
MLKALGYREARPNNDPSKVENVFFGVKGVKNNSTRKNARPGTLNTLKGWFGFATPGTTTPVSEAPTEEVEEAVSVISNNNSNRKNGNNTIMVNEMTEPIEQNAIPATMPMATESLNTSLAAVPSANVPKRRGFITNAELRAARAAHTNNTGFGRRLFNNTLRTSGGKRRSKRRSHKRRSHKRRSHKTKNRRTNRK